MLRIRDSLTGEYISREEADKLTPERYVVEHSKDNSKLLETLLRELEAAGTLLANVCYVDIETIKAVLMRHGLKMKKKT